MLQPIQNMEYYLRAGYGELLRREGQQKARPLSRQHIGSIGMLDAYISSGQHPKTTQQQHQHQKPNLKQINQAGGDSLHRQNQPLGQARRQERSPVYNTKRTGGREDVGRVAPRSWGNPTTPKVYMDNPQHGPRQEGRVGIHGRRKKKGKGKE